jgi:SP family general alpha glucoside:H+ symporter-like MFS transporter
MVDLPQTCSAHTFTRAATEDTENSTSRTDNDLNDSQQVAAHATDFEDHDATIWQTIRENPWACFWCLYACWTIILVAFETQASGAVVSIPQFRKDFGFEFPQGSGKYVLPAG